MEKKRIALSRSDDKRGVDMIKGSEELLPRAVEVEIYPEYQLLITFNNGERRSFDAKLLMDLPEYKMLKSVFNTAQVRYGTVVWAGDIDVSPDTLYLKSRACE